MAVTKEERLQGLIDWIESREPWSYNGGWKECGRTDGGCTRCPVGCTLCLHILRTAEDIGTNSALEIIYEECPSLRTDVVWL